MPDHSNDDVRSHAGERSSGARRPRTDWRFGGRTVLRWREGLLAWAFIGIGLGVIASALLQTWGPAWSTAAQLAIWVGMLVPVVVAFSRSRPAGLLRFRPVDLLLGAELGLVLRVVQGWIEMAVTGSAAFPSFLRVDGQLAPIWWFTDAAAPGLIAPVIEEFAFRAVVLVALYATLRRPLGAASAAVVAGLVSTALFVLLHVLGGTTSVDGAVSLAFLGLVCGALVLRTGRIWPAVVTHVVYNLTYFALGAIDALLR